MRYIKHPYKTICLLLFLGGLAVDSDAQSPKTPPAAQRIGPEVRDPTTVFTIAEIIETVGTNPETLLSFFVKNIVEQPYSGSLRDPRSVLITKAANSLDGARFLASLLSSAGHETRIVTFGSRPQSARTPVVDVHVPVVLTGVATSTLREVMAVGDRLYTENLLKRGAASPKVGNVVNNPHFGVQLRNADTWRTIYGDPANHRGAQTFDLKSITADRIEFSLDLMYGSGQEAASQNVLRAEFDVGDIAFTPVWLDFTVRGDSATAVLHRPGSVVTGTRFPVSAQPSDRVPQQGGGLLGDLSAAFPDSKKPSLPAPEAQSPQGAIRDIRLGISARGKTQHFTRSFSLKSPSSFEGSPQKWEADVLTSIHGISVVTGTPSLDYLAYGGPDVFANKELESAYSLNAFNLGYFVLRNRLPASPHRPTAYRIIDGINVLTSSVYPAPGTPSKGVVVMNLLRKSYQLFIGGGNISFAERMWNGFLDRTMEQFMMEPSKMSPASTSSPPRPEDYIIARSVATPLPFELSQIQIARLNERLGDGVIVAYSRKATPEFLLRNRALGFNGESFWWEISADGNSEDWNRWDRHQVIEEGIMLEHTTQVGTAFRIHYLRLLSCAVYYYLSVKGTMGILADPAENELLKAVAKKFVAMASKSGCTGSPLATPSGALDDMFKTANVSLFRSELEKFRDKAWIEF